MVWNDKCRQSDHTRISHNHPTGQDNDRHCFKCNCLNMKGERTSKVVVAPMEIIDNKK